MCEQTNYELNYVRDEFCTSLKRWKYKGAKNVSFSCNIQVANAHLPKRQRNLGSKLINAQGEKVKEGLVRFEDFKHRALTRV